MVRTLALLSLSVVLLTAFVIVTSGPRTVLEPSANPTVAPKTASPVPAPDPTPVPTELPLAFALPSEEGKWAPPGGAFASDKPTGPATVNVDNIGQFTFDAAQVETKRPDIFRPGHFSVFDALVRVAEQGEIELEYHFDETMNTHVIDAVNGNANYWYRAYYAGGWAENNAFRMDMYPYKNGTHIRLLQAQPDYLEEIHRTFAEEVQRLERNGGQVIIPEWTVRSPTANYSFRDVRVTAHDVRSDVFQPGVLTALDVLLSLGEQGKLPAVKLTWYGSIGSADPVQHYWVEQMGDAVAHGGCGFVYETGPLAFRGFTGSHIHIPSDTRVMVSPEYALWFWICL